MAVWETVQEANSVCRISFAEELLVQLGDAASDNEVRPGW